MPPRTSLSATLAALAVAVAVPPLHAQRPATTVPGPPTRAVSEVRETRGADGAWSRAVVNRTFRVQPAGVDTTLLLVEEVTTSTSPRAEEDEVSARVTAWLRPGRGPARRLWSLASEARPVEVDEPFYVLERRGCCAVATTRWHHSLWTGRMVFRSTSDVMHVEGEDPASPRRIAYLSADGWGGEHVVERGGADAVLTIWYASPDRVLQAVAVLGDRGGELPRLTLEVGESTQATGAAAESPYSVRLAFPDGAVVRIPVRGERMVVAEAELPPGVRLAEVRPPVPEPPRR